MNDLDLLRTDLAAAHYGVETLAALWGDAADAALHRSQRVPALRALADRHEPAAVLARLFVLGVAVPVAQLQAALPSLGVDGAERLGLGRVDGALVHPLIDLRPYSFVDGAGVGSWWVASDLGELAVGGALPEDHVLGVGGASATLSGLIVGEPVESALDLGTGCGIQAMHVARHASRVVATDISARALRLAAFNAELNGIRNIEFRRGSLFEPVVGERFDLIVSNPPFVITPRADGVPEYEYRDGGMVGDGLVESVVAALADHLTPGGIAQLLGNWEYRDGEDGLERAGGWARGLDVWIVEREVQDVAAYAETWIRDGGTRPGSEFDRLYAAWLDDFERRGVRSVGFGYLLFRAASSGLRRLERLSAPIGSALGPHYAQSLAAHDWLRQQDDATLGRARLTVAGDVTEERHYWPGAEDPTVMTLRQGGGFARSVALDTGLAAFVGACDGELELRAIVAAIAQLLEVDGPALSAQLLPSIRELVLTGFLRRP